MPAMKRQRFGRIVNITSQTVRTPNVLVVPSSLPVKTVQELVAYGRANPDKLSFGSPGIGTSIHVSGELFKTMTGFTRAAALSTALILRGLRGTAGPTGFSIRPADGSRA